ncbi:unnamed protein product [Lactuca virosa]|uniref:Uncharacterized protein n=1 Tax=Lactuca virosa TaxID=75947 RepID=A0AAU9PUZ8_9ASTR|nr:unnamed protein product [Lactuca virosa]
MVIKGLLTVSNTHNEFSNPIPFSLRKKKKKSPQSSSSGCSHIAIGRETHRHIRQQLRTGGSSMIIN